MEDRVDIKKVFTQTIDANWLREKNIVFDVLRLDAIHKNISGNKWFKLKYYLQDAVENGFKTVATFGGAYSNHIIAMAAACKNADLKSIGIIRGEGDVKLSHTLLYAQQLGMQLQFVSRLKYRDKESIKKIFTDAYCIDEGGYGSIGAKGAAEILGLSKFKTSYSHIICAVGTGTMMAGIIQSANPGQQVIGISAMKGNDELINKVSALLTDDCAEKQYHIEHLYHFGGYAKHPAELITYMNAVYTAHNLPTDIIYTAKVFYAIEQMVKNNDVPANSKVLMVHSGGLQGNLSLPNGKLYF